MLEGFSPATDAGTGRGMGLGKGVFLSGKAKHKLLLYLN
jgi:hypothetical protein